MEYLKLGTVTTRVADGEMTLAALVAAITADTIRVVNVKGLIFTAAQVSNHIGGGVDGEALLYNS